MKTVLPVVGLLALAVPASASAEVVRTALLGGDEAVLVRIDHKDKHRGKGHGKHHKRYDRDDWDDRRDEHRAYRQGVRDGRAQAYREFRRGEHLPYEYRRQVVYDYGRYDLPPPPYGHHYVRAGDDTYLIQIATGLILNAFLGGGY